ncbi:MAG: 2,3-bisphosphoglycerate-independent phosphoglycerate mutase, partial [Bdellovibrionales bacterium]|nr:2,3-bisphosphoglycerate-independent phosphoglycerate mutase [Bdellovibrionales bacterium]
MKLHNAPVLLVILDGLADNPDSRGNAVAQANTPTLDSLRVNAPMTHLTTFGARVGLPDDQMGNSEVGHLNIGAGRVVKQELTLINEAVREGTLADNAVLREVCSSLTDPAALHLVGLVSDGGVHSSLDHAAALAKEAARLGVRRIYIHAITDGRDRPPTAAVDEVNELDDKLKEIQASIPNLELQIVSICGRYFAMDRDTRWERTKRAYDLLTQEVAPEDESVRHALEKSYQAGVTDEFVEPVRIASDAVTRSTRISDGDAILFFNFRADRMRQIVRAFFSSPDDFSSFERAAVPRLASIASLTEYEEDFPIPVLFRPHTVVNHLGSALSNAGARQLRIAETEKYPHVAYFFNGGEEQSVPGEERILI